MLANRSISGSIARFLLGHTMKTPDSADHAVRCVLAPLRGKRAKSSLRNMPAWPAIRSDKKGVGRLTRKWRKEIRRRQGGPGEAGEKVKKGGAGVWGQTPMPPNSAVPAADVSTLVKWVLSQK